MVGEGHGIAFSDPLTLCVLRIFVVKILESPGAGIELSAKRVGLTAFPPLKGFFPA